MKISRFARGAAALMTAFLLLCLCGCDIQELSTLRAFAKPFEGEYRCEYAATGRKTSSKATAPSRFPSKAAPSR